MGRDIQPLPLSVAWSLVEQERWQLTICFIQIIMLVLSRQFLPEPRMTISLPLMRLFRQPRLVLRFPPLQESLMPPLAGTAPSLLVMKRRLSNPGSPVI